jgi:saposin
MAMGNSTRGFMAVLVLCMVAGAQASNPKFGTVARLSKWTGKEVGHAAKYSKNYVCDTCLQLSQEAQLLLSDPETLRQVETIADQFVCSPLQPGLQVKCEKMVDDYVPAVLLDLESRLGPDKLCFESGLCTSSALSGHANQKKSCTVCQDLATDALTYLEKNKTQEEIVVALHLACAQLKELSKQCDLLVDVYTPRMMEQLDNITPQEFCQMTKMCKPPKLSVRRNDCTTCQFVILELKVKLKDPKTQERVLDVFMNGCNRVANHVDECKALVEQYGPFILANLDSILDSEAICCKAGFCHTKTCPQKEKSWTNMVAKLTQKMSPRLELPQGHHAESA